ncbi:PadR family transcriptional regulator [Roseivirga spongicola]|jgi:DNA-binding PadR family transcriptional regulator|uniref:PadR family transcriptional regulator n=1 Tax=Roseivirga spongicola TaxID=333140 RepID=A0A150X9C1_9BACT|nr:MULTISPECIES: PadR family transcriptional regulator [Roseivirga]KYG75335.1 PadR family transcriptional regulator [Roseivirga spongicola]MBO6494957.1 PadR family transcriptional regulator [Roseivirga sp.]
MKGDSLGEFEELVLLATCSLGEEAYANTIKDEVETHSQRTYNLSAIHAALYRLEDKGFLSSHLGDPTQKRGGKRKRIFQPTSYGIKSLKKNREMRESLWQNIPASTLNLAK